MSNQRRILIGRDAGISIRTPGDVADAIGADWAEYGFAAIPPNAAIVVTGVAVRDPVAIELRNPRYDETSATLEVEAASLAGDASGALATILDESGRDGRSVIVFIDATAAASVPTSSESVSAIVDLVEQSLRSPPSRARSWRTARPRCWRSARARRPSAMLRWSRRTWRPSSTRPSRCWASRSTRISAGPARERSCRSSSQTSSA